MLVQQDFNPSHCGRTSEQNFCVKSSSVLTGRVVKTQLLIHEDPTSMYETAELLQQTVADQAVFLSSHLVRIGALPQAAQAGSTPPRR